MPAREAIRDLMAIVNTRLIQPGLLFFVLMTASAQEVRYGTGIWDADVYGTQRAVIRVQAPAAAVRIRVPWRRRDREPEKKEVLVISARTEARVMNVARVEVNREYGELVFQPVDGPGDYWLYYLPYTGNVKSPYPKITYRAPEQTADPAWLARHPFTEALPNAELVEIQSVDEFNSFAPMELIATKSEVSGLLAQNPSAAFLVFPEDREHPIRMTADLPAAWTRRPPGGPFEGTAARGEFYVFQLGIWAARTDLRNIHTAFTALTRTGGKAIPAESFRCFNLGGVDWQGRKFTRQVDAARGSVRPLWCGVQVPPDAAPGVYSSAVTLTADSLAPVPVSFHLTVTPQVIRNAGDDEPSRLSRLRWLDSQLAVDDGIVPPYTPVKVDGRTLSVLGRTVSLGSNGLPASIRSYFAIEMTRLSKTPREVLSAPISLVVEDAKGRAVPWSKSTPRFVKRAEGAVGWEERNRAGALAMDLKGEMEFDGSLEFSVALTAREAMETGDIRLEIPVSAAVARYAMGLGMKGGARPDSYAWKWDVKRNQDSAWVGDVNAGLQFGLHDDRYSRPLNTNFYLSKPLIMPASWDNGGKGGCRLGARGGAYLISCYSGPRRFAASETQHYDFRLLLTPFHPIDPDKQWSTRYYHAFAPLDEIAATTANTVNIHHATPINPFINYPFLRAPEMKAYIDDAHRRGMKVKIYDTVRELTNHAPELPALLSLGGEVIADGPGGGPAWLQEHVADHYIPGWYVAALHDAALVTTGTSRWHNFYVEGLRWLAENVGIDGIYLDDIAFDRTTMKRVRKVLARNRPGSMIDVHSANQFNPRDGYANSANLYLEHFPFVDRLWFGEYFDYNSPPDFWLVEISGIPYGLMGEMLQDNGNPWRGMVYGMTNRLPHSGDPRPIWRFWDEYRIAGTEMLGYWVPSNPVKTGRNDVLATTYRGTGRAIVAVASWAKEPVEARLQIDWKALGMNPAHARIVAPAIENFQKAARFADGQPVRLETGKGWLLVIDEAK